MSFVKETILPGIIIGVFSSFSASFLFLWTLFRLRPNIEISPYIAVQQDSDGNYQYRLKIINRTHRDIINIKTQLMVSNILCVPDGLLTKNRYIKLKTTEIFQIPRFDKNDKNADYAWRFLCLEDLDEVWQEGNGSYLRFRIIATDSLTGFSKVFTKSFYTKSGVFIEGSHRFGNSLEVI